MLYEKTNGNNSLLDELKSFCLALILVTSLFYIGLNSFHFNHSVSSFTTVAKVDSKFNSVLNEINTETEICRDLIVSNNLDKKIKLLPTINTQIPVAKSIKRLTKQMKIKDPVSIKSPTGLSSSLKPVKSPTKKKQTPAPITMEPILGVSKPYTLSKAISKESAFKNISNPTSNPTSDTDTKLAGARNPAGTICNLHDHIPTDQTKKLMASHEVELTKSHTGNN